MYLIFFVHKCSIIPKKYLWDTTNLVTCDMSRVSFWDRSHISSQLEIRQAWDKLQKFQLISYACLTVIWLANSGSIELCEIIYQLNFIYLCISYFLSTNVQSYQRNICETKQTLWHVTCLASHFETGLSEAIFQ